MKEQFFSKVIEAGGRLTVKSALNPVLWLCGIISLPIVVIAGFFNPNIPNWIIYIGCAPVATAVLGFIFLLLLDRDKLQSEEYQLKKRSIELSQQKGDPLPIEIDPSKIIENPDKNSISKK